MNMNKTKDKPRTLINLIGMPSLLGIIYFGDLIFTSFIYITALEVTSAPDPAVVGIASNFRFEFLSLQDEFLILY